MRYVLPKPFSILGALLLLALLPLSAFAQHDVPQSVLGSGGTDMSSTNYGVRGTVGQANIGTAASDAYDGKIGYWYLPYTIITKIDDTSSLPKTFSMDQNYPNPFNPTTTIQFALPRESFVKLRVYDVRGKVVAVLVDETRPAGVYEVSFDASSLASGIYFYRIQAQGFVKSRKLVLMK